MPDLNVPPNLAEWWPYRGIFVTVRCRGKLWDGKLKRLAPTGAFMVLRTADGDIQLPLDECELRNYRTGRD